MLVWRHSVSFKLTRRASSPRFCVPVEQRPAAQKPPGAVETFGSQILRTPLSDWRTDRPSIVGTILSQIKRHLMLDLIHIFWGVILDHSPLAWVTIEWQPLPSSPRQSISHRHGDLAMRHFRAAKPLIPGKLVRLFGWLQSAFCFWADIAL